MAECIPLCSSRCERAHFKVSNQYNPGREYCIQIVNVPFDMCIPKGSAFR